MATRNAKTTDKSLTMQLRQKKRKCWSFLVSGGYEDVENVERAESNELADQDQANSAAVHRGRPRKRKQELPLPQTNGDSQASTSKELSGISQASSNDASNICIPAATPSPIRKRGRPRRIPIEEPSATNHQPADISQSIDAVIAKSQVQAVLSPTNGVQADVIPSPKRRGRPPKNRSSEQMISPTGHNNSTDSQPSTSYGLTQSKKRDDSQASNVLPASPTKPKPAQSVQPEQPVQSAQAARRRGRPRRTPIVVEQPSTSSSPELPAPLATAEVPTNNYSEKLATQQSKYVMDEVSTMQPSEPDPPSSSSSVTNSSPVEPASSCSPPSVGKPDFTVTVVEADDEDCQGSTDVIPTKRRRKKVRKNDELAEVVYNTEEICVDDDNYEAIQPSTVAPPSRVGAVSQNMAKFMVSCYPSVNSASHGLEDRHILRTPLTMMDYMHRSTFLRFTANERQFFERLFRGYLISQLDQKLAKVEAVALNDENVNARLSIWDIVPAEECVACERAGRPVVVRNGNAISKRETRPHMQFSSVDPFATVVSFVNPLYRNAITRYPDLRLCGHNANKLMRTVAPKVSRRNKAAPVAVHLCPELYGDYESSSRKAQVSSARKVVRPLLLCRSHYSPEAFKRQSQALNFFLERRLRGRFPPPTRRRRHNSEAPPFTKVAAPSPLGTIRIRASRSLSPVLRKHKEANNEPFAYKAPYTCQGIATNKHGHRAKLPKTTKHFLCSKLNGSFVIAFSFEQTEQAVLMPTRDSRIGNCRFRKIAYDFNDYRFLAFSFSVIEDDTFSYLARIKFSNEDNRCLEMRPEAEFGALLPIRIVYNYIRLTRMLPKPIEWQKPTLKRLAAGLNNDSKNDAANSQNSKAATLPSRLNIVDIFKWLGLYCVIMSETKARFAYMTAFGSSHPPRNTTTLGELLYYSSENGGQLTYDYSEEWMAKSTRMYNIANSLVNVTALEKYLLGTVMVPIFNKRRPYALQSLVYYQAMYPFKLFELYQINSALIEGYAGMQAYRYAAVSEPDSEEYDTDMDEDFSWECHASISTAGDPIPVSSIEYAFGNFSKARMKDPWRRDISDVVPPSRHLQEIQRTRKDNPDQPRIYVHWDESSDEELIRTKRSATSSQATSTVGQGERIADILEIESSSIDDSPPSQQSPIIVVDESSVQTMEDEPQENGELVEEVQEFDNTAETAETEKIAEVTLVDPEETIELQDFAVIETVDPVVDGCEVQTAPETVVLSEQSPIPVETIVTPEPKFKPKPKRPSLIAPLPKPNFLADYEPNCSLLQDSWTNSEADAMSSRLSQPIPVFDNRFSHMTMVELQPYVAPSAPASVTSIPSVDSGYGSNGYYSEPSPSTFAPPAERPCTPEIMAHYAPVFTQGSIVEEVREIPSHKELQPVFEHIDVAPCGPALQTPRVAVTIVNNQFHDLPTSSMSYGSILRKGHRRVTFNSNIERCAVDNLGPIQIEIVPEPTPRKHPNRLTPKSILKASSQFDQLRNPLPVVPPAITVPAVQITPDAGTLRARHEKVISKVKKLLEPKPLLEKLGLVKRTVRKHFGLPIESEMKRLFDAGKLNRVFCAAYNESNYESFLQYLEAQWYWYWSGERRMTNILLAADLSGDYNKLKRAQVIETENAFQETRFSRRMRRHSFNEKLSRFSNAVVRPARITARNSRKTPFDHYIDQELRFSRSSPGARRRKFRSISLPRELEATLAACTPAIQRSVV